MPLPEQFKNAAQIGAGDPAVAHGHAARPPRMPQGETEAQIIDEYNKSMNEELIGNKIESLARKDNNSNDLLVAERLRQYRHMASVNITHVSISDKIWGTLAQSVPVTRISDWTAEEKGKQWDRYVEASRNTEVNMGAIRINPDTGLPMTRATLDTLGPECSTLMAYEDLLLDERGRPVINATGTAYFSNYNIVMADDALEKADRLGEISDKVQQIADGTLPATALDREDLTMFLANQNPEERQAYYGTAGLDDDAISEMEAAVTDYQNTDLSTVLGQLNNTDIAVSYNFVLDNGDITPGVLASPTQAFSSAAYDMLPPQQPARFLEPVNVTASSISLQRDIDSPLFAASPAPGL